MRGLGHDWSWRSVWVAATVLAGATLALLIPLTALAARAGHRAALTVTDAPSVTDAPTPVRTPLLHPAPGQTDPTNLWDSTPIPAVATAVAAVKADAPLPATIIPQPSTLSTAPPGYSSQCSPAFGPGVKPTKLCFLGDSTSSNVVAVIGDSHSGRWIPALNLVGRELGFAVVPLGKAGCQINVYLKDTAEWPCASWYRWAIAEDHALHPVATLVTFLIKSSLEATPGPTVASLQSVLSQVTHGVYIADPPYQTKFPGTCLTTAGASMGKCASAEPSTYATFQQAVTKMTTTDKFPSIPTLQWFCADKICPMVINDTITTSDRSHLTTAYSESLAGVLAIELKPILAKLEGSETYATSGQPLTGTTLSSTLAASTTTASNLSPNRVATEAQRHRTPSVTARPAALVDQLPSWG